MGLEGQGLIAAADVEAGDIEFDAGADAGRALRERWVRRAGRFRIPGRRHR